MRFDRVRLENFKCYDDADLRLGPGVTVIHGLNGSGKSSLLEACFFALYGSNAIDRTLDEIVTIGADDAEVELWFSHAGSDYHVERRVRATGGQAQTARCVLEAPEATIEGARDVRRYVADLLRMDSEAFVNCAYVRQGEVNKLINATPEGRQDILDSLLQLGKLEEYRERASDARVGVGRVRDDKQGALSQVVAQIEQKENADLHDRLNVLESDLADAEAELENLEQQREKAVETRDSAREILEEYEEKREELDDLEDEIGTLREAISETEREREELADRIGTLRDQREETREELADLLTEADIDADGPDGVALETVEERIADLESEDDDHRDAIEDERVEKARHEDRVEALREEADELEREAAETREEADELEREAAETRETLAERRGKLDALDDEIEELRGEFGDLADEFDASVAFGEAGAVQSNASAELEAAGDRVTELETEVENQRSDIEEAEQLLEAGKCPECGQDVEGAPHVESIDEERERLAELEADLDGARERRDALEERVERADRLVEIENEVARLRDNRENVEQLVSEREDALEGNVEQVERLREEADELEREAEKKRESADDHEEEAAACRERIAEHNEARADLRERRDRLERVVDLLESVEEATEELADCREERERLEAFNDERREQLADKRDRRDVLEEEFDESRIENAGEERERAEQYLQQVEPKLEELRERRDSLQADIGAVRNGIEELESLRERRDELAGTVDHLESLYDEAEQLENMYGTLRAELRQRNVESLEAMLNEIFELVYGNDSYARIELSGDYELTVYQKDGEPLDPDQLSGGERALFNLSLRCAIYRLLAEGIEGTAPMPPLILDEPTVFLDSGHVSRLVELVGAMVEYGVEQILVVSHDEELVAAADDLVRVRKDPTTNRSTVERTDDIEGLAGVELDADTVGQRL